MLKSMKKSRLVMAGGTLTCAMGIGVLMQMSASGPASANLPELATGSASVTSLPNGKPIEKVTGADTVDVVENKIETATEADSVTEESSIETDEVATAGFDIEEITLTRAEPAPPAAAPQPKALPTAPVEVELAALADAPISDLPAEEAAPSFSCDIEMAATPGDVALVALDLSAPCMINERFTLHHNGMMITGLTDDDGRWNADIPALSEQALFIVAFPNGDGAVANAKVDALSEYDRYVVQWQGYSGVQIHALEYGAEYGQDGHVWLKTARDASTALRGEGGFLLRLGEASLDDALLAEVYTFPLGAAQREGDVEISLEAEVTKQNCGRDIQAQALVKTAQGLVGARDLELAVPECNAVGDFLVLKNLYEDLKIARN